MSFIISTIRKVIAFCAVGMLAAGAVAPASAQLFDNYDDQRLVAANEAYEATRYDHTVELTDEHLNDRETSTVERAQAYRLQGLALVALGDEEKAVAAAENLVRVYPSYEASVEDPPAFNALVEDAQDRHERGELAYEPKEDPMQIVYTSSAIVLSALISAYAFWDAVLR